MWETYTSKLSYLVAPVSLHLSIEGFMYIKDAHNALIYSTFSGIPLGKSIQSQLSITDGGDLVIKNSTNTIWNQLALTGANNKYTLFEKRRVYCDSPCHKCLPRYPQPLVALNSDGYEFSPKVSGYLNSTQLCSKSGQFCVYTNTSRIALNDNVIFPVVKPGETVDTTENGRTYLLDLSYDGNLRYFDLNNNNTQVWKSDSKKGFGPFTSSVSDSGLFGVYDSDNKLVWSYQWYDKSVVNWKTSDNGDWAAKCNSIGDDFQTVKASSPQDCQTQCFNTGNCNAWGLEGDVCYFKYKLNASRDTFKPAAKTDFCGLVKPKIIWFTSPEGDWGDHCDWPGNDNSMVFANNVKDCQAKCNGDGLCNSWAFFGNNCYLKNKPEPTRAKFEARTGIISCGIAKSKILWHGSAEGDWGEYCDWPGDDYKNVPGNDPVACQSVCFGDGNCNAWAITAGTCYLKIKPQPTRAGFQVRSSLQYCGMVKSKPLALPYYSIRSIQNKNYCIDYAARNLAVTVYDCNDSSPQKWAFKSNDKIESLFDGTGISYRDNSNPLEVTSEKAYYKLQYSNSRLIQMSANQCIGVPKGEYSNYAKLIYETCNGGDNQKWELVGPTFTSYYMQVRNQKNNVFCMNLDEGRNILTISSCNTVDTQRWNFYGSNNSVYSVKGKSLTYAAVDGKYMLIGGGAYLSVRLIGGKIQTLDGYWCVTVPGGNFVEGQQLAIEVCNGDEHQNWTVANI
ncbi:hypothetical protein BC833DRAFT_589859 [Globomyces pollinis-pini]|nr:hypothetical protein BC833DRAFT_589859 [Globomyces pollinis-pini]